MAGETPPLEQLIAAEFEGLLDESMKKIGHCVEQLSDEQLWQRPGPSMNSVGNLLLHISGNLQQWAVCGVGQQPDQRDRDAEFSATGGLTGDELLAIVERTVEAANATIRSLPSDTLSDPRSIQGFDVTVLGALSHTVTHFVGHTHQIIQLTRLMLGDAYAFQWTTESPRGRVPI